MHRSRSSSLTEKVTSNLKFILQPLILEYISGGTIFQVGSKGPDTQLKEAICSIFDVFWWLLFTYIPYVSQFLNWRHYQFISWYFPYSPSHIFVYRTMNLHLSITLWSSLMRIVSYIPSFNLFKVLRLFLFKFV